MTRAFYALTRQQQVAFRNAVGAARDGDGMERAAFRTLDIDRATVERTHTHGLHALVTERLALTPEADRNLVEPVLFGGPTS